MARKTSKSQPPAPATVTDTPPTSPRSMIQAIILFYRALLYFLRSDGDYINCPFLKLPAEQQTKIHLYGLWLDLYLWEKPHYRAPSYRHDLLANLRNVAVPGTGIPLHRYCYTKLTAYFFIFVLYPIYAFLGAMNVARKEGSSMLRAAFVEHLLAPEDWFVYWRLNSRVVGYHELLTHTPGYKQEDKWTFLVDGERLKVPVTPVLKVSSIVIKHKSEEGGLGIYFYRNALVGGDWIIQERLDNSDWLNLLLPDNAPLSTLRVITASKGGLTPADPRRGCSADDAGFAKAPADLIEALSCVFRAGRQGANTDHSSILFDVDVNTGLIKEGSTNAHWYQLGLDKMFNCSWRSTYLTPEHPDCKKRIAGVVIEDMEDLLRLVRRAHFLMLPDVPFVGWDVALTSRGVFLLEVNLSCNFFRGSFDRKKYFSFIEEYLVELQNLRMGKEGTSDKPTSTKESKKKK